VIEGAVASSLAALRSVVMLFATSWAFRVQLLWRDLHALDA